MPITDWPLEDRPREKLLAKGSTALTDAELLAIFLKNGQRGQTALDLAKMLLNQYGNLKKLFHRHANELIQQPGIGPAKFATLQAALELGKRYLNTSLPKGARLNHSALAQQFLIEHLSDRTHEVFACLFLDTQLRLLSFEILFEGTLNETQVYPREILKRCLTHHATNIILAHNHPSGHTYPSQADKEITQLIKAALALIDVVVVDHLIIGHGDSFSFAEAGFL